MGHVDNVEVVRRALENPFGDTAFAPKLVWHFTGHVPGFAPEYHGVDSFRSHFLGRLMKLTGGAFQIVPIDVRAAGPELVVAHIQITMTVGGVEQAGDDVVVYRLIDGMIVEAFDIPSRSIGG
jgi:hypothetical protein